MKNKIFKHLVAFAVILSMLFCITACGSESGSTAIGDDVIDSPYDSSTGDSGDAMTQSTVLSDSDLRYVMIYNPKIYDENNQFDNSSLKVGAFGSQIDTNASRADGLETEQKYASISQMEWMQYLPSKIELEGDRADPMGIDYKLGDKKNFYYTKNDLSLLDRSEAEFTCIYVGEYCHIWSIDDSVGQSAIEAAGREFDEKIYKEVAGVFGTPRFVGETGKVNILLFEMPSYYLGYFANPDIFLESEHSYVGIDFNCNTGHAIININIDLLRYPGNEELTYSTLAHELQHLINTSAFFSTASASLMNTWLNEGMSGYIETVLYPNSKELSGHYEAFNESDLIRNGQSLYNFASDAPDVGVYGSVYYFSKYLEKISGKNIFADIMEYWRDSYSLTLSVPEALANSVSKTLYNEINSSIDYSTLGLTFESDAHEWMSKLCLNFYLSTLSNNKNISDFEKIKPEALLYDSIDSANIEGGGRLIIALNENTFEIPEDSDSGLVYIGLDKDFQPITEFICK